MTYIIHKIMLRSRHVRNYRNSKMTTLDVQLGTVHVLGLGIIRFYSDSQQNEPATV